MLHKDFRVVLAFLLTFATLSPAQAQDAAVSSISHEDMTRQSIRDRVSVLRQERHETMPYLDKGYIRYEISPERVKGRSAFTDSGTKSLEAIIQRSLQVYTPARAAQERISLANRRILVAVRKLFPEVDLEFQKRGGNLSGSQFNSRNYRVNFRQPIFRGGVLWNTVLQEKASLEASKKEYEKTVEDLIFDVSSAYFEYMRSQQAVHESQEALNRMKRFLEISEEKYKEEIISEIENLNVQSVYNQARYDAETAQQEHEIAKLDMQKYLDLDMEDSIQVENIYDLDSLTAQAKEADSQSNNKPDANPATPPVQGVEGNNLEGNVTLPNIRELVDIAYQNRSELQVEASKMQAARFEERARWGEMIPHADITMSFGKLGESFDLDSLNPGLRKEFRLALEVTWNLGGNKVGYTFENNEQPPSVSQFLGGTGTDIRRNTLTVGVLDGLDQLVGIKEAEVAKIDQIIQLEKAEKQVVQEVKQAYFDYQKYSLEVRAALKRVDYRKRLALLAEHRLEQNEIQISEYLQAESDSLRERNMLHKALKDFFESKAKLNRAIGRRGYLKPDELLKGLKNGK